MGVEWDHMVRAGDNKDDKREENDGLDGHRAWKGLSLFWIQS